MILAVRRALKKSTRTPRTTYTCVLMTADEVKEVCSDRRVWRSVLTGYLPRNKC